MSITEEQLNAAIETARAEGATAERQRIAGIMQCNAAKDRPVAAKQIAMATNMSAEDAAIFLAGLPAESRLSGGYRNLAERAADQIECGGEGVGAADAAAREATPAGKASAAHDRSVQQINAGRAGEGFETSEWKN